MSLIREDFFFAFPTEYLKIPIVAAMPGLSGVSLTIVNNKHINICITKTARPAMVLIVHSPLMTRDVDQLRTILNIIRVITGIGGAVGWVLSLFL